MRVVVVELINGLQLGLEQVSGDEEDEYEGLIALNLFFFRFVFMKMKEQ